MVGVWIEGFELRPEQIFSTNNRRISSSLSFLPRPSALAADISLAILAFLRNNRDYSRLLSGDDGDSRGRDRDNDRGGSDDDDDGSRKRHRDYQDRRSRLKELERQKLTKGKNGFYSSGDREADSKGKANGGGSSKADGGAGSSKDKKKLPYDRSFGSFFGPSQPVVAKRIIEEARARQEAEIVAAREARANKEAERKKAAASLAAGKSNKDKKPMPKAKPVDEATLKVKKLKEARDFAFLYEDTPLPPPKADKKAASTAKPGADVRRDSMKSAPSSTPARRPPLPSKTGQGSRPVERLSSARPSQTQVKSSQYKPSQPSRPSAGQAARDLKAGPPDRSDRSAGLSKQKLSSTGKPLPSKTSATGSARLDPRREVDSRKEATMRKLVAGSPSANGKSSSDRRGPIAKGSDRRLSSSSAQASDRRLSQSSDRRPSMAQASDRCPGSSQVLKKGSQASASGRSTGGAETRRQLPASQAGRQSLQSRPTAKPAARPIPSGPNKSKYADDPRRDPRRDEARRDPRRDDARRDEMGRRRARSPSEESDERPRKKVDVNRRRPRNPSEESDERPRKRFDGKRYMYEDEEEDDDSFIDDDEDQTQVSDMIRKMFRYDPSKYRGEDLDDRAMEVGFRTIEAEERKSAREARLEDERELALIEEEERQERLRKLKKKRKLQDR